MLSSMLAFDEGLKFRVHIAQITCIILAIAFAIGRFTINDPPATRSNVLPITFGIKSLIVIGYQLLTEHTYRYTKWASTKANAILNVLEVVFWLAALVVTGKSIGRDFGAAAGLSALVLILVIVLEIMSIWMAGCSVKAHRLAKATAVNYYVGNVSPPMSTQSSPEKHAYPPPVMQPREHGV